MGKSDQEIFSYTYSASDQEEVKSIRKKYVPQTEDKMEQLKRLNMAVYKKASIISLTIGFIGVMLLGIGMCCTMVWEGIWFIPGVIIGIIGMGILCLAYPLYNRILKKEREEAAPEIIRLSDELLK